jgi:hypothetical protein
MGALQLLQVFGPILSTLIPQISTILKPGSQSAQRDAGLAQVIIDTITKTAGQSNLQGAIESMQNDPAMKKKVTEAVVTHPEVIGVLEIGGGMKAAGERNLAIQTAEKPFWYNPSVWVTAAFFPMMYFIVWTTLMGGTPEAPWWAGQGFDPQTRSGLVNLIVGMVFGGVVGLWFGTSYGSMRKTEIAAVADQVAGKSDQAEK